MNRKTTLVLITLVALLTSGCGVTNIPEGTATTVAFVNANVIPMDSERVLEGQTVVAQNGRIAAMGPSSEIAPPSDAHVIDGQGRYLIPGLSEMHGHLMGIENDLLLYLANGVTTVRDMGEGSPIQLEWRDQINAGTRVGPNLVVWSPQIGTTDEYHDYGRERVNSPVEAEELVTELAAQGYDGIKAHAIGSSEIYRAILKSADKHGLPVDGHAPEDQWFCQYEFCPCEDRTVCWNEFIEMEIEAVAHVEELLRTVEQTDESIRQAARDVVDDGMWVGTTIGVVQALPRLAADLEGEIARAPDAKYVGYRAYYVASPWDPGRSEYAEWSERDVPGLEEYVTAHEKMLVALYEEGALLLSGADTNEPLKAPGFSLLGELEAMVELGLSPYDVLRTSTYNPAMYLGRLAESGTIETGKRADLVLLEGNPLEDIASIRQITGVMVRGHWYTRTDLDLMLGKVATANQRFRVLRTTGIVLGVVVVAALLVALVWFVVRRGRSPRRGAAQITS